VHSGQAYSLSVVCALRSSSLNTLIPPLTSGIARAKPNGPFTTWSMKMLLTLISLLDITQLLHLTLFVLRVPLLALMPRDPPSVVPHPKIATSYFSKVVTANLSSPSISKVIAGFPLLLSWSYCVPGQLEQFSTMLPLGSSDSAFSLQSAPSVHVATAR